jgi:hypothetical protein
VDVDGAAIWQAFVDGGVGGMSGYYFILVYAHLIAHR